MVSDDGINWSKFIIEEKIDFRDIIYNDGLYIVIGAYGDIISFTLE